MKKLQLLTYILVMLVATSCSRGRKSSGTIGIMYSGKIVFNADGPAGIQSISPKGFMEFHVNDKKIRVEADTKSNITYQLNGGDKNVALNNDGMIMLTEAIKYCKASGLIKKPPYVLQEKSK